MNEKLYAETAWTVEDVESIRSDWSRERCEAELSAIEDKFEERLIETGWEILEDLLPSEDQA